MTSPHVTAYIIRGPYTSRRKSGSPEKEAKLSPIIDVENEGGVINRNNRRYTAERKFKDLEAGDVWQVGGLSPGSLGSMVSMASDCGDQALWGPHGPKPSWGWGSRHHQLCSLNCSEGGGCRLVREAEVMVQVVGVERTVRPQW